MYVHENFTTSVSVVNEGPSKFWKSFKFAFTEVCTLGKLLFLNIRYKNGLVQVPCIVLLGSVMWYPNVFLYEKLPHMASALDRKALANVTASRVAYLQQTTQGLIA